MKNAIAVAEAALGCTYNFYPTSLQYLANPDGSSSLVHVIQVKNDETGEYYQAHVDAHTGKLISTINFVAEATVSRSLSKGYFKRSQEHLSILLCQSIRFHFWMVNLFW